MTSSSVLDQWVIVKHRASGYTLRNGELVNIRRVAQVELPSYFGVLSSVRDLATWDMALWDWQRNRRGDPPRWWRRGGSPSRSAAS